MKNVRYWLWLQQALGEGAYIKQIIEDFGSVKGLYDAKIIERRMSTSLTPKQVNQLENTDIMCADPILYDCENNGWTVLTYEDEQYPQRLREIYNPPAVLYIDGRLPDIDASVCIGIVGTRKASEYAVKVAHIMSKGITEAGAVVISGGALGVDTAAHKGALMAQGKTIAVLGCGLGTNYLNENKSLRNAIKGSGALVTEYPPFTKAGRFTFPLRNRIISGLSVGVLVVEAGVKSGSLITANFANEQGRDVYAVPGSVLSDSFAGTNKLIHDGASVVTNPTQLIEQYASVYSSVDLSKIKSVQELMAEGNDTGANLPPAEDRYSFDSLESGREKRLKRQSDEQKLTGDMKTVYESLTNEFIHIDKIIEKCGLPSAKVLAALTRLEILDLAVSTSGKRYKLF